MYVYLTLKIVNVRNSLKNETIVGDNIIYLSSVDESSAKLAYCIEILRCANIQHAPFNYLRMTINILFKKTLILICLLKNFWRHILTLRKN